MRLPAVLAPFLWSYAGQFAFLPLAVSLNTPRPDLVAGALQAVGFVFWTTGILAIEWKRAAGESEPVEDVREVMRSMWSQQARAEDPYALTIAQDSPYYRLQGSTIEISKRYSGGAPWLGLPVDLKRYQVEGFYDTVILRGKAPTESNLAGYAKPFSQLELRTFRDWLYRHNWIVYLRKGENSPWSLTPRGRRVVEYIYRMLQGEPDKAGRWVYSPIERVSGSVRAGIR